MSVRIGHLVLVEPPAGGYAPTAARRLTGSVAVAPAVVHEVLPSPPADVLGQVGAAADRVEELYAANRELHFAEDADSGRMVIEVRDLDGNVLRTIPPSEALDVMSGASAA